MQGDTTGCGRDGGRRGGLAAAPAPPTGHHRPRPRRARGRRRGAGDVPAVLVPFRSSAASSPVDSSADGLRSRLRDFQQIIDTQAARSVSLGISLTYFSWLGWTLFTVTAVLAIVAAALAGRAEKISAAVTVVVAPGGVVTTMLAIQLVHYPAALVQHTGGGLPGYADFLGATGFGAWLMLLAYVLLGAGAVLVRGARQQIQRQFAARPEEPAAAANQPASPPPDRAPTDETRTGETRTGETPTGGAPADGVTARAEHGSREPGREEPDEDW